MKSKFLPVLTIILISTLCCTRGISKNEVWQNNKIDTKLRTNMEALQKQVFTYMASNSYGLLSQLFSDTLLSNVTPEFTSKFMPQIQRVIKGKTYRIYDQYYFRNVKKDDSVHVTSGKGDSSYSLIFHAPATETYVSMLVSGDSVNEVMITLVFIKENSKWKVYSLLGEDYSLNGRNYPEQYTLSRKMTLEGDLIDAVNTLALASHCANPGGRFMKFAISDDVNKFSDSLTTVAKAKYPFPYTVSQLAGKPVVFNIHYEVMDHHFTPMIMYLSTVNLADTVSLEQENKMFQKQIGNVFTGMDKNNNTLLYRAYNEQPREGTKPGYYGYVQHLN